MITQNAKVVPPMTGNMSDKLTVLIPVLTVLALHSYGVVIFTGNYPNKYTFKSVLNYVFGFSL